MGLTSVTGGGSISAAESVSVTSDDVSKSITLANAFLQVRIASDGTIDSLKYKLKSGSPKKSSTKIPNKEIFLYGKKISFPFFFLCSKVFSLFHQILRIFSKKRKLFLIFPHFLGMERECVSANEKLNRFVLFDDVPFYCTKKRERERERAKNSSRKKNPKNFCFDTFFRRI